MSVTFGSGELGQIVGGSTRVQLTWDDLLWAARMLVGEAGAEASTVHGAAVLWCMASRLVQARGRSYTRLIQAYSQPINPIWRRNGSKCRVGGPYHGRDECSEDRLRNRDRLATLAWEDIPSNVQDLVYQWARGRVDNPIPRAVHFAVPAVTYNGQRRNQGSGGDQNWQFVWDSQGRTRLEQTARGGNAFVSTNRSREWEPEFVKIVYLDHQASDSSVEEVSTTVGPARGERSRPLPEGAPEREPPTNNILERTSEITSDRTSPPTDPKYDYLQAFSDFEDQRAASMLSEEESERILKVNSTRFYEQVAALKQTTNFEMTKVMPVIKITTESDEGGIVNLNDLIFSASPYENRVQTNSEGEVFDTFPDRPIASIESFEVTIQEPSVGGVTGIQMGTLSLKIHNTDVVTRRHPVGKYIAYMMSSGFVMRIKYGIEGAYDGLERERQAFQWREQDFFVTQYNTTIHNDKTMTLKVSVMPATFRLLNQLKIGQSIPVSELGTITNDDLDNIVQTVVSDDPDSTEEQAQELRRRLSLFVNQLNSVSSSPAVGFEERSDGTLGSQFHAALTNREIFELDESISPVPVNNMVEALQTIQAVLLTRRFETILTNDCYRYTNRGVSSNVVDLGPLIFNIVKPEMDYIFSTVARNQIEIGEKFSVDESSDESFSGNTRTNVKLIFGNFNARAGQWANKPISTFPINVESIFSHLRQVRSVGDFSSTVNAFLVQINREVHEMENYNADTSSGSEEVRYSIQTGEIKYYLYPDPTDPDSWIMYFFDNKTSLVQLRNAFDSLSSDSPPTKDEIKRMLEENKIPWVEMGEEFSILKEVSAATQSDDLLATHNMLAANRMSSTTRDMDASVNLPAGISRDLFSSAQMNPQSVIRSVQYVAPIQVSVQSFVLPTAYYMGPIFLFLPIRTFSGIYLITQVRHDIKKNSITNLNLQVNLSLYNNIAV